MRRILPCLILAAGTWAAFAGPVASTNGEFASRLVAFSGRVEVSIPRTNANDSNGWVAAQTNQLLLPGSRLRTFAESRATLQLSDRSVVRINQSTTLEIQHPSAPAKHRFGLKRGGLFFLDREKAGDVEFETPLATGAIRGTEFELTAGDTGGVTELSMLDGSVDLKTASETVHLNSGQKATLDGNQPARLTAVLSTERLAQWSFYYPAVLNPADLDFSPAEKGALAKSLAAYSSGDLFEALASFPKETLPQSAAKRVYHAALELAVGQTNEAVSSLNAALSGSQPLREMMSAITLQTISIRICSNSSGWLARSYYLQSRSELAEALNAARQSARLAPDFGFAWERVAELEFCLDDRDSAREALNKTRQLSPRNAQAIALEGFLLLEENRPARAIEQFSAALALDDSLPSSWVGRALALEQSGDAEEGRKDLQIAATLEPHRALYRSYLGKSWSQSGQDFLAEKEFALAQKLDAKDPTAWLYSALHRHQNHQINGAARDLQHSVELNDNRSVFRSRLQLDRDLAARSADLSAVYDAAGMSEAGANAASRAVDASYSDFAGHLFLSRSLARLEDSRRFNLRYETPRESELLLANLLSPSGGGNLSQILSQQDHLQYFDARPIGFSSLTGYSSGGDKSESATVFGKQGGFSYALDGQYLAQHGQRANNDSLDRSLSLQARQQVTTADSLYFQAGYFRGINGDVSQLYSPSNAIVGLRVKEEQSPNLFAGWHHEWSPGSHTLVLLSRLADQLTLTNPSPSILFLHQNGIGIDGVSTDQQYLDEHQKFTLYSAEVQQIWELPQHTFIVGGRYQGGAVDTSSLLTRPINQITAQNNSTQLERINTYGYYQWKPVARFHLTAGLGWDQLAYPRNVQLPPILGDERRRTLASPKVGFAWQPWNGGWLRGAWTRSLGGLFFDNSIRLEPAQVEGSTSVFRSLIPESVEGSVPGTRFTTWSARFDQTLHSNTFFGVGAELLKSEGSRSVGAFTNIQSFIPIPNGVSTTLQTLGYREASLSAYVNQLIGRDWSVAARYRMSEAKLNTRLPELVGIPGATSLEQNQRGLLHHVQFSALYNHPCGLFAQWASDYYHQENQGYTPALDGADFWQHNLQAGYVFSHRHAELRVGLQNLANQDYRLNPLNLSPELQRRRTFFASFRLTY